MTSTRTRLATAALLVPALALAGCAPADPAADDATLAIVASTSVYGDIVSTIAGDAAEVTAIISDIAQDPHDYEATTRDALALSRADLVVMNGGGYDSFMTTLLDAQTGDPVVVDAVAISGLLGDSHGDEHADHDDHGDEHADHDDHADHDHGDHDHGAVNEHVWYELHVMIDLVEHLAHELSELDAANAALFERNADALVAELGALDARVHALADTHDGLEVAVTEPVPLYLLELAGLHDATPVEFTRAIESGADAPALVVQEVVDLVSGGGVVFLAYNEQTVGPQTERVLEAAQASALPVLSFSELLPEGMTYLEWMTANVDAIEAALS